eukprot:8930283-Ditylum_brightwellii.AAC.1
MALKLNGVDETTIKKLGRWCGNTFTTYIHAQIGSLMAGASAKMIRRVPIFTMSGLYKSEGQVKLTNTKNPQDCI